MTFSSMVRSVISNSNNDLGFKKRKDMFLLNVLCALFIYCGLTSSCTVSYVRNHHPTLMCDMLICAP